ncbi:fibrocystin-L-like [Eucyclogobius newberryi]|uniref:fibrocystin-L-like n=1 Tax=Eucyclogobius newberryi TaxID=166745 RepID=UPI003B5A3A5A
MSVHPKEVLVEPQGSPFQAKASQFQLNPGNGDGNHVTLVSDTMSFVCDVERDSTHGNQIMCYTRAMPYGTYDVKVTVDRVIIPDSNICKYCVFSTCTYRTPKIRSLDLLSGLPGSLLTIEGMIITDAFGSSNRTSTNTVDSRIVRSITLSHLYQVSSLNKLGMFQTFAEVTGVSPSQGSIKGGTTLTIHGRHLGDQTDYPARVVVGGLPCEVLHVADDKILCKTSEWKPNEFAEFGVGGRGLKMEIWNDTSPGTLEEIWTYNENATGYWTQWIDSTPHLFADEHDYFTTRTRGFLVPPSTGKFILHLQCDDRCELYMSNSSRPEHKEKLAFQTSYTKAFSWTSQQSKDLFLEEGKPYYIEILQQESRGKASVTLAMFSEKSSYTEKQTSNAQNEVQILIAEYDVHDETQVVAFEAWTSKVAVKEVQKVTIVSGGNYLFSLGYGPALTAPLAVSASASVVEAALNDLWSIKPDTVKVSKAEDGGSTHFTITFNSDRGDFAPLTFNDFGADINITVVEATKGQSNMETFTLTWENVPTRPIAYNATEEEMQSALEELFTPKCPAEIVTSEGPDVKYFKDFEDDDNSTFDGKPVKNLAFCGLWSVKNSKTIFKDTYLQGSGKEYGPIPLKTFPWLCFAYKGLLNGEVTLSFTYRNFQRQTVSGTTSISVLFQKGPTWSYKCINLLSSLQGEFAGSLYQMTHLSVGSDGDFYIDAVHIGRSPTTYDENAVAMKRRPPPFESSGRAFESISVSKNSSAMSYQISAKTMDCAFGFPMIEVGFMQKSKDDEDMGNFTEGAAVVTVTRTHKATPPLNGTFDVEIYEDHVKGLSIDINEEDLERDLQRISEMGEVEVKYVGTCRKPQWRVEWVSKPGNQPEIKIDSSNIVGPNVHFFSQENKEGGMLHPRIMGDHFRVMEAKPQAQVFINNIPSWCSGDCSFEWSPEKTPVLTGISPSQGSVSLGTLLTVTGTGFANENAVITVGDAKCNVTTTTSVSQVCSLSRSVAGTFPVTVTFPSLGNAKHSGDNILYFTYQLIISSFSPVSGSLAGGTPLTIKGFGFGLNATVTVGNNPCVVVDASETELKCKTPPGVAGSAAVSVSVGDISETASDSFSYDNNLTAQISSISPKITSVSGHRVLTIEGSNLGARDDGSAVLVGGEACVVLTWTQTNITCLLPVLPPRLHHINVQVQNNGNARMSDGENASIEYILEVHSVSPLVGSLMGGTKLTVTGAGFGQNASDIEVSIGVECEVTTIADDKLECVLQSSQNTTTVTNKGIHKEFGEGYAWKPASLKIHEGDEVVWHWITLTFLQVKYRVFSVPTASSHTDKGGPFNSGAATANGSFSYVFSVPGVYYYSSGFVDPGNLRFLQGTVEVLSRPQKNSRLVLKMAGIEAKHVPAGSSRDRRSSQDCVASPLCPETNQSSSGVSFTAAPCSTPTVQSISPNQGTYHQAIHVTGNGFGNVSCAIKVTVGDEPCHVINSSNTDLFCRLGADSELPIGIAHPLALRVDNLGSAIVTVKEEMQRRFVLLPVVDKVWPHVGSTNGFTRLALHGSGFSDGAVTAAGRSCNVVSVNYTHITCDTSESQVNSGEVVYQDGQIRSTCTSNCSFEYSTAITPSVSKLSTYTVSGPSNVEILGVGFGDKTEDVYVTVGAEEAKVLAVEDDNITIAVGALPAAAHRVKVIIRSKGLAHCQFSLTSEAKASLSPEVGSLEGGTPLVFTGNGFAPGNTNVTIGSKPCVIQSTIPSEVRCLSPPNDESAAQVEILVFSMTYPVLTFNYSSTYTPVVSSVSPDTGPSGTLITLTGSGFGSDQQLVSVSLNHVPCSVSSVTETQVQCTVGNNPGGPHPIMLQHQGKGHARSAVTFNYELTLSSVQPSEGSFGGGALLSIQGSGFDPESAEVQICGHDCKVDRESSTSSKLSCYSPHNNATGSEIRCVVFVSNPTQTLTLADGYTYKSALTPAITDVSPRRGRTAGGVLLTITGSGFSTNMNEVNVTIAGVVCNVQSTNPTHILCVTTAQPQSQKTKVHVNIKDQGMAPLEKADFFYIDVWSSSFTWQKDPNLPPKKEDLPPEKGTFVVIAKNQTILLDISTPVLKMLLIQGTLVFDEADIELQAENILITEGGALQIGTEEQPFQHKATITLHGMPRSPEIPMYGAKTLGVREGTLDMHGIPIPVPWTRLAETANIGSSTLKLMDAVTWKKDDEIVIASTGHRHSQKENEMRTIASVSQDGKTLTLTEPLDYSHLGVQVTLPDGTTFEGRAEVGLLTRNIRVRGSTQMEWADKIEACPEGFNSGEFSTQTCFQGRFGEETGSLQFGACIMLHAPEPNKNLAIGRIEYVEIYNAGQAFRLGRYPIHWHLMGNIDYKSYVRGCSIHHTFNRAVTIHNTHRLLVEHNVVYNVMGGALFIEDGIETENILQYNLAVFVKQSTSLLNDDVTPAAYWVTNPNNIIRHNTAAGGTHFGFWYRMHTHPDGPSYDPNICQKKVPLGVFENNTVHSQGWFGLWIFQDYFPMKNGNCNSRSPEPAIFKSLTTWNCEKGAEWVNVGAVHFDGFVMVNNEKAGTESKRILPNSVNSFSPEGGAVVSNSKIVGHVDELGLGPEYCTGRGIIAPLDDGLSVINTKFMNFDRDSCAAFGVARIDGTCIVKCGGWAVRCSGITYFNTPNKAGFRWEHEVQLVDMDGSLTGNINYKVVPTSGLLDPAHCTQSKEWSAAFNGSVCDDTVNFHRLAFNNPSPTSLAGHDVLMANKHGSSVVPYMKKRMTHKLGWMALLPSKDTFMWSFIDGEQITNISYSSTYYGFKPDQFVIMAHSLSQSPDRFQIVDERNGSATPLSFSKNEHGDWYFDKSDNTLYYLVSGKTSNPVSKASADPSLSDVDVKLKVYRCFYPNCIEPTPPPPATLPPLPEKRPDNFIRWSDAYFWSKSPENKYTVPGEGAEVVIPAGQWVVLDTSTPALNKLTVNGVLEIPDDLNTPRPVVIDAIHILIKGGWLLAGSPESPFQGELHIKLRGNHRTPDWPLPNGPNLGSKALGVFGILDLYGKAPNVYHTKLSASSAAGTKTLTLATAVDWQVGDEVAISTSSYDVWETEKGVISAVSQDGLVLTLDKPLTHTHIGETYTVPGTAYRYTLAADVALLTRNIKIIGEEYPDMTKESFGARVLVGTFSFGGIDYKGKAQIKNVEFHRTGQEGWTDDYDPRYSVAFLDLEEVEDTYLQGCSFHDGFSPAIGVFNTEGLFIEDNVIHHTVGEGIRIWGYDITVRRNLVMMTLWPGSYQDREETNFEWNAAIEVNKGTDVVLQNNIVAGFERVAYRINGEPCPGTPNESEMWRQNEAHGGLYGVYLNQDGLPDCSLIRDFFIWKSYDFAICFQVTQSMYITNVTLVDNGLGLLPLIYAPPSLTHRFEDKKVTVESSLIVGSSPNFNCSETVPSGDYNIINSETHRIGRPPTGGRSGLCWPSFNSGHNNAPEKPFPNNMNYNAIKGLMTVTDTTFVGFKAVCSGEENYMFITNTMNEDLQHPVQVSKIKIVDSSEDNKVFIHRASLGKVNPSDCVDMECDAKKKTLLRDEDGSFLGAVGAVVPQSEFAWGGDARRGLGDYRIPKILLTHPNGSRIPVNQVAPNKGVIRKDCTYMESWQSYNCKGLNYRLLAIESLDADTETRRLSPVALLGDGYLDLINGPQDHGWCAGYTCQKRLSLFHGIVATGHAFDVFFSSVSPQKLRLMMINAASAESVLVSVFYSKLQRLDVYVNKKLIAPTNVEWNDDNTDYTLLKPMTQGQYVPQMNAPMGSNFFDREDKMLKVLVRGSQPVEIRSSPVLVLAFNLPAMTVKEFFGPNLINNLAKLLNVPLHMIRITNVGGGARRRKRSSMLRVEVEIKKPPVQETTDDTNDEEDFVMLRNISDNLGQAAVSGDLSKSIGYNVASMDIIPPPPPASDPDWNEVATEEETREETLPNFVSSVSQLLLMVEPVSGVYVGPLSQQPSLKAVDQNGDCVSVGVTTLKVTASLKDSKGNAVNGLLGNATIKFKTCWANFTNLGLSNSGEDLTMVFTLKDWGAQSRSFSVQALPTTTTGSDCNSGSSLCVVSVIYALAYCSLLTVF